MGVRNRTGTRTAVTSNLSGTNTVAQDFTNGLVYEWNLNTQYEFLPTWVLELGYVGSHGIRETCGHSQNGLANTAAGGQQCADQHGAACECNQPGELRLRWKPSSTASLRIRLRTVNLRVPFRRFRLGFRACYEY